MLWHHSTPVPEPRTCRPSIWSLKHSTIRAACQNQRLSPEPSRALQTAKSSHIMDSHGLCNWYSQPTLRVLHNSYSSRHQPTLGFFLIWYVSWWSARPVIHSAWNGPSSCLWYDEWPIKLPIENTISLESCDKQLFNYRSYIFVTSVYQSKRPIWWSPVHQMDHPAVCDMISGPLSFLWSILYHWKAVIYSCPTVYIIYL